jgi:hypothetical protein
MVIVTLVCALAWKAMETIDVDDESLGPGIWWYLGALFVLGAALPWFGRSNRLAPGPWTAASPATGSLDPWKDQHRLSTKNSPNNYHLPKTLTVSGGSRRTTKKYPGRLWPLLPFALLPVLQIPILLALLPFHFTKWPGDWTILPGLGLVVVMGYFGFFVGWAVGALVVAPLAILVVWLARGRRGFGSVEAKQAPLVAALVLGILLMAVGMVLAVRTNDPTGDSRAGLGDQFRALIFLPVGAESQVVGTAWLWTARIGVLLIVFALVALLRFRKRYPWLR